MMEKHRHCSPGGEDENFNSQLAGRSFIFVTSVSALTVFESTHTKICLFDRLRNKHVTDKLDIGLVPGTLELMLYQEFIHT